MSVGLGLLEGAATDKLIGIRPGDIAYEDHTGAVYHPQNEGGNQLNIAHFEITNPSDIIEIDVQPYVSDYTAATVVFFTPFGATDYDVIDPGTSNTVVSEQSGFDNDSWVVDISAYGGRLNITNFNTGDGVAGTESAWYPYVAVFDRQE
jgi:hypothetical protein